MPLVQYKEKFNQSIYFLWNDFRIWDESELNLSLDTFVLCRFAIFGPRTNDVRGIHGPKEQAIHTCMYSTVCTVN